MGSMQAFREAEIFTEVIHCLQNPCASSFCIRPEMNATSFQWYSTSSSPPSLQLGEKCRSSFALPPSSRCRVVVAPFT